MPFKKLLKKHHWYTSLWAEVVYAIFGFLALLLIFGAQYATGEFGFAARLEKTVGKVNEPMVVVFSHPMAAAAIEKNFEIDPAVPMDLSWSDNYQRLSVRPQEYFSPGELYKIKINPKSSFSVSSLIQKEEEPVVLTYQAESLPRVVSITPASGDPSVKIDSAVKINFDKSTFGYDVNFIIEPFSAYNFSYNKTRTEFTIIPKAKFEYSTDYAISVKAAPAAFNLSADEMPEIFRANFKTEPSPPPPKPVKEVILPETDENGKVLDSYVATTEAKIEEGKYIDINLAKQQLSIFEDGERLGTYQVSTGKRGMATPTGKFKVMSKAGRAYSKKYKLYMPYWMQFTGAGHGIHELPEWANGYKEGANHLGVPVSHGCVRLGVGPAAKIYGWTEIGTPVVIHH